MKFDQGPADHPVTGYVIKEEDSEPGTANMSHGYNKAAPSTKSKGVSGRTDYRGGQYSGYELSRSHKLNKDPILELKHIIGY
jgi:hypothetical protein